MPEALAAFLTRALGAAVTLSLQVVLARMMTTDGYGQFAIIWSWLLALGGVAALGFTDLSMRLMPRYGLRGRVLAAARFTKTGLFLTACAAMAMSAVGVLVAFTFPLSSDGQIIIAGISLALPFLAVEFFLGGIARAMGWQTLGIGTVFIARPAIILAMCFALWFLGFELGAGLVSLVLAAGLLLSVVFLAVVTFHRLQWPHRSASTRQARRWIRSAVPAWIASGLDDLLSYADVVLVGLLLSPAAAGIYFAGSRVLTPVALVQYAFVYVTPRRFSQSIAARDATGLSQSLLRASLSTSAATILSIAVVLLVAPLLLSLFGQAYKQAIPLLPVLAAAHVARAAGGQAQELMLVAGRNSHLAMINAATLVVLVLAMLLLVPPFGMLGAAIALAGTLLARSAALLWQVQMTPQLQTARST